MTQLNTSRLDLIPLSLAVVECVLNNDRQGAEALTGARFPDTWPGREIVERAFACPIDRLRENPESYLWGSRILVARDRERSVVGSVVLNGEPDSEGAVEVGYGVEPSHQGKGFATEGTQAVVDWALTQTQVRRVVAATFPWHTSSLRVIEKIGMVPAGTRAHDFFGDLLVFHRLSS